MATSKKKLQTLQESIDAAVELLPPAGQSIEFDEFKAQLYAANPDGGRDAFAYMLKNKLVKTTVTRQADKSMRTTLERSV
jgi:hypothetical protein